MADVSHTGRRPRRASILDVAALAGVSPSTVSRSLRGYPNIAPATRQRVLDAAKELSYSVSPQASGLASGRTMAVAVVVPFLTRWFFANVVAGASDVLRDAGFDVLLYHLRDAEARDRFFDHMPLARRVDGVLTMALPLIEEHTLALRALDMPLVTLGVRTPGLPSVRIDEAAAATRAVRHLLHQGHEDIALLVGRDEEFGFAASRERRAAFAATLADAGLPVRPERLVSCAFGIEGGAEGMVRLLDRATLPTAVVAEYDELAIGAWRTLRRASVEIPRRLSVVGIDDHEMASVIGLTTVAQPVAEQGATAARLLLAQLATRAGHAGHPEPAADRVLPTRLIVRSSTGPPFAAAPVAPAAGRPG